MAMPVFDFEAKKSVATYLNDRIGMDKTTNLQQPDRKVPTHEIAYDRLRDMILFGELAPGEAVTIQGLTGMLEAGMTPVREAIRRLTAEGALVLQGNRRVCVPQLTRAQLDELSFARQSIEPRLAYLAAEKLTDSCIRELDTLDGEINRAIEIGDVHQYLLNNYRFHFVLYEKADAGILMSIAKSLWLQVGPSLRVVCGRIGTTNLPDKHEEALAAMRSGDGEGLARAIGEDIRQGIDHVRDSLDSNAI